MTDQAAGLRSLFARRRPSLLIVAGSDEAKAAVAVHFAREAAAGGRATVLVDGTAGQVATACDLACRYELSHVVAGDVALSDVVRSITPHLLLLPAARALARFATFTADEHARLAEAFSSGMAQTLDSAGAEPQIDLIVVHAEEGQAARAVEAFGRDARVVVVASDLRASLRGAYLEMKTLAKDHGIENFEIVTPHVGDAVARGIAFANLSAAARRFLDIELVDGGAIRLPGVPVPTADATQPFASPSNHEEEVPHAAAVA